jgi:hypothetical protein
MNEKIRELARQADLYAFVSDESIDPDIEKFAELIVRECAELANEETSLPYDSYSEKIKKHFGVEL